MEFFNTLYGKHYKKLVLFGLLLLLTSLTLLTINYARTGDIIKKDVSLQGGTTATIYSDQKMDNLEQFLKEKFPKSEIVVRQLTEIGSDKQLGVIIEATEAKGDELKQALEQQYSLELTQDNFSVEEVGTALGESFYRQMMVAMGIAFLLMSIVVFIIFRNLVPSVAVIITALTDITTTIVILNIMGMRISSAGVAALLMLIGYSIDTDMLLTTKALKRHEGTTITRMKSAIITGMMMTATTLVAMLVALPITQSQVIKQMFTIILIGLVIDIIITYTFNAGALVWYLKKKQVE